MQTKYFLLSELKTFCEKVTEGRYYDVSTQKGDTAVEKRPPSIHRMRLPDSHSAKKYAPYILLQYLNGITQQKAGQRSFATATIRFIFCVYNENEEEGALDLLNLMETVASALLKEPFFSTFFYLDREAGLEDLIYTDDTRPFYAGEMVGTFIIPEQERNVNEWLRS